MDDANLDLAVDGAVWGGFGTTGPALYGSEPRGGPQERVQGLYGSVCGEVKSLKVGNGWILDTEMGPCINEQQLKTS